MNITQVKIFPVEEEKLKAFVSIVFDHCFMVNDIKVIQGKDGLFLSMPSRRKKSGEFKDVAHPLNNATRRHIEETVLTEYRSMVDDPTPRRPDREGEEDELTPKPAFSGNGSRPIPSPTETPKEGPSALAAKGSEEQRTLAPDASPQGVPEKATAEPAESRQESEADEAQDEEGDKSLEEVQERHLRDSFWTVS